MPEPAVLCRKLTLVGVGLLGGSLGLAARRRQLAGRVEGYVRRSASLAECERAGAVDHATTDLAEAVAGADLVVLCTPVGQMRALAEAMRPSLAPGAVVIDSTGVPAQSTSVRRLVYDAQGKLLSDATWYSSYRAAPTVERVGPKKKKKRPVPSLPPLALQFPH